MYNSKIRTIKNKKGDIRDLKSNIYSFVGFFMYMSQLAIHGVF